MRLPLSNETSPGTLRQVNGQGQVTFDPLAVATVLPNPRANISATQLYTQHYNAFQWPYLMMLGGTLPPLGVLVQHVLFPNQSLHPALSMVLYTAHKLPVRSTTIFRELPVDFSKEWVAKICNYKPSMNANNDFVIINIDGVDDETDRQRTLSQRLLTLLFPLAGFLTGAALVIEFVLSVMLGDMWAAVLFFVFLCHWLASTLISFTTLIGPYEHAPTVKPDSTTQYALHQRKEGGTIIFKGRQDSIEKWARQTWQFNATLYNKALHWFWILSGTAAAVVSTAAMVNMSAALQLSFLGLLLLSSLAELGLARLSRAIQVRSHFKHYHGCKGNKFRTQAIIRSALEGSQACRLQGLDWIELGLLPRISVFSEMQNMLTRLEEIRPRADLQSVTQIIDEYKSAVSPHGHPLVNRIAAEAMESAIHAFNLSRQSDEDVGKGVEMADSKVASDE